MNETLFSIPDIYIAGISDATQYDFKPFSQIHCKQPNFAFRINSRNISASGSNGKKDLLVGYVRYIGTI